MPSKVVSALLLLSITLAGAGLLYASYSSYSGAFEEPQRPLLRFVAPFNGTHDVYLVVSGCLDGVQVLVYDASSGSWRPASRACSGSLVVLSLGEAVGVAVVEGR